MVERFDAALAAQDRAAYRWEQAAPTCCKCGWQIQDEHYYDVDGEIYCEECIKDQFRRNTDDYRAEALGI